MDFSLSEEQLLIRDSFRGSLEQIAPLDKVRQSANSDVLSGDIWRQLTDLGMPGLLVPESHCGSGLKLLDAVVVSEELGRVAAPVAFTAAAIMAPLALLASNNRQLQSDWLPKIAAGEARICVGVSEASAGARSGYGVETKYGSVEGKALYCLDAGDAEAVIAGDQDGNLQFIEMPQAGLSAVIPTTIDTTRRVADITFSGAPASALTSNEKSLRRIIDAGRIMLAADSLGAAEVMLEQAVAYAMERRQFNRVIGSFQAIKHLCADMAAQLQPCRALIWYAAYAFDHMPQEASLAAALAKSQMDDVGRFVARSATEVHGGMGYTDLQGLHFWFKRIGFNRALLGGPERLREEAARLQGM